MGKHYSISACRRPKCEGCVHLPEDIGSVKIISPEQAKIYQNQGWKAADLHAHTFCSPDVISARSLHPQALLRRAKEMGMDFVTFTDHDTMSAYDLLEDEMEGVVTGVEIKIKDVEMVGHTIHVNVYDLNSEQFHELKEISGQGDLGGFINYLVRNDLPYIYNHPLWFERKEKPNFAAIPDLVRLFPVLEYNMHRLGPKNEIIMALARQYGKGLAASTDCHAGEIGMVYTLSRGESFREFFENICRGNSFLVVKDLTRQEVLQEINRWIELIFSPDIWDHSKRCSMGVGYLNKILKALSSNTLRSSPRMGRAVYRLSRKISNSGLPAWMYLRSEGSSLSEIESQLSMILR